MKKCNICGTKSHLYFRKINNKLEIHNICKLCRSKKISEAQKGRKRKPHSKETRMKISKSNTGKKRTQKHKDNISKNTKGKNKGKKKPKRSYTHCLNLSKSLTGRKNPHIGVIRSKKTREKISKGNLGKTQPYKGKSYEEIYGIEKAKKLKCQRRKNVLNLLLESKKYGSYIIVGKNETRILNNIEREKHIKILRQYRIIGYSLDGYDFINNIVYEVDEKYHSNANQIIKDEERELNIIQHLGCEFIRIKDYGAKVKLRHPTLIDIKEECEK